MRSESHTRPLGTEDVDRKSRWITGQDPNEREVVKLIQEVDEGPPTEHALRVRRRPKGASTPSGGFPAA